MLTEQAINHVRETFTGGTVPKNVAAESYVSKRRLLRRFTAFTLGSSLFSAEGSFNYRIGKEVKRITFNGRNLQFRAIYDPLYKHGYEIETALLVANLCNDQRAFWDVGANWGYFSLLTASLPDFKGQIEAFEPNPRTYQDLRSTVEQAGLNGRIQCHNLGAGSKCCEMTVAESDQFNSGLSRLTTQGGGGVKVPVTTLDDFKGAAPGFIKIDAEGMEFDILKGAQQVMRASQPHLLFENFSDYQTPANTCQPMELLQSLGYKIFIPVVRFLIDQRIVSVTYGSYCNPLFEQDAKPRLGLVELKNADRFLYSNQMNLVAVHTAREPELQALGLIGGQEGK